MIKKKIFIFVGVLLLCTTATLFHVSGKLPYYYQAKLAFLLNNNEMRDMASKFESDTTMEKFYFTCVEEGKCDLQVRFVNEESYTELTGIIADEYIELGIKSNLNYAWKHNGNLVFSIGALSKFDKDFQIAYVYYPDGAQKNNECKEEDYKNSIVGHCDIHLSDNWSVHYFGVNLDKYEANSEISNQ